MTPSEAYAAAYERGGEHDQMQAAVVAWCRANPFKNQKRVVAEYTLTDQRCIRGFVDVAIIVGEGASQQWLLFEIKPHIQTPAGLLRQVNSIKVLAERFLLEETESGNLKRIKHTVMPLVFHDDPMVAMYSSLSESTPVLWHRQEQRIIGWAG